MKICFISSMHPADDKRVHAKEAVSLNSAGFEVVHICPGGFKAGRVIDSVSDGVRVRQYFSKPGLRARLGQLKLLYKIAAAEKADVYHCNEVDSWFVGVALKIVRGSGCVFDVHEHYPSTFAESRFHKILRPSITALVKLVFSMLLPFTDRVVLAKRTVGGDFRCPASKKVLVQNFSPLKTLAIADGRIPRAPGAPMTMVHLGLFSRLRGWPQVLDALALCDERVQLHVVGTINDGSYDQFKARVRELGLQSRVKHSEWMPFDDAFQLLLEADVGLIAFQPHILNHVFAMPHKLFDYMAAGMAVLMPKQAIEVAPIVEETKCGLLIDPSSAEDIANGIEVLLQSPEASHQMGKRGQAAVKSDYNWEVEAEKLVQMYKEIV